MNHPEDAIEIVKKAKEELYWREIGTVQHVAQDFTLPCCKSVINWLSMSGVVSGMRHLIMAQKELNFHKIYSEL